MASPREDSPFADIYLDGNLPAYLSQGDIIANLPPEYTNEFEPAPLAIIVVSNTCDLVNLAATAFISVAPVFELGVWIEEALRQRMAKLKPEDARPTYGSILGDLANKVFDLANYQNKRHFFLPPHKGWGNSAAFASLDQLTFLPSSDFRILVDHRTVSINSAWKEQLGYRLGYLFNRVATPTPDKGQVQQWTETNYRSLIEQATAV
jgi:hypothetical protein